MLDGLRGFRVAVAGDEVVHAGGVDPDVRTELEPVEFALVVKIVNLSTRTTQPIRNLLREKNFGVHRT